MQRYHMVPVIRVTNGFHARVIAARLGAEGIVTQLRGGIDTPYPIGDIEVLVPEAELADATALLLADEVESAFEPVTAEDRPARQLRTWPRALLLALAAVLVLADIAVVASGY